MGSELLAFVGVAALLTVSPGADMALVTRNALAEGQAAAQATSLGIGAGLLLWGLASALGLAALVSASATAFLVLKAAGAAYLVLLGVLTLRRAHRGSPPAVDHRFVRERGAGSSLPTAWFGQGLSTNLLNPKIAVFYTTVLPQFISPEDPVLATSVALALIHVALTLAWLSGYAYLLVRAGDLLRRSRVRRAIDALTGAALIALGLRLAVAER